MYTMYTWCVIFLAWDSLVVVGCLICRLQYQECHVWVFVLQANLRLVKSNTTQHGSSTHFVAISLVLMKSKGLSEKWEKGRLDLWKSMTCSFSYFRVSHTHIYEKYLLVLSQDYEECPCIYFWRGHSDNVPSLFFFFFLETDNICQIFMQQSVEKSGVECRIGSLYSVFPFYTNICFSLLSLFVF